MRGNFPAARGFAEPDTYTTTRRRAVGNESSSKTIIGIISRIITSIAKRLTHYLPVTQTSSQRPSPYERSYERSTGNDPTSDPTSVQPRTILRAIIRAIKRAILRAILQTMLRMNRSNTRKASGRPWARVERTAATILTSLWHDAEPTPRYAQAIGPPPGLRRTNRCDICSPPAYAGPAP